MPTRVSTLTWSFLLVPLLLFAQESKNRHSHPPANTFSIVARDPATGEMGVAVQSRIPAVGAVVPYASAGIGVIASQALANVSYGPVALALLHEGTTAQQILNTFQQLDPLASRRQVAILPWDGPPAVFTGQDCSPEANHQIGEHFTVQGNLLANPDVIPAMAEAFTSAEGLLPDRMIAALRAGQAAGGDRRGKQSAALLIVRTGWGYGGGNDRFRDLRVDDHPDPIEELARVLKVHREIFPRPEIFENAPDPAPVEESNPAPDPDQANEPTPPESSTREDL